MQKYITLNKSQLETIHTITKYTLLCCSAIGLKAIDVIFFRILSSYNIDGEDKSISAHLVPLSPS